MTISVLTWIAIVLGALAALAFAGLVVFALYAAWRIYRPQRSLFARTPDAVGLEYAPLTFPAADGRVNLSAWLMRGDPPLHRRHHTIVLCHQWGANKAFSLAHAEAYCKAGFDVLAFDLRNHGDSQSDRGVTGMSKRFTDDVRGAVVAARAHPRLEGNRLTVHAFSFSTFPAVVAAAEPIDGAEIDALVLDSGPTPTTHDIMRGFFDGIGVKLLPSVVGVAGVRHVFRKLFILFALRMLATDWPSPRTCACRAPMLLIGGGMDTVSSPDSLRRTAEMFSNAQLVLVPAAKHLKALRHDPGAYLSALLSFHDQAFDRHAAQNASEPCSY